MYFNVEDLIKLRLYKGYNILDIISYKIKAQFVDFFEITKRIDKLAYRLKLSNNIKIYDVVFVVILKPLSTRSDLYRRRLLFFNVVIIDNKDEYIIKKLVRKRRIR